MTPETREIKVKIKKWTYIKLRSFCTTQEIINKMEMQPTEWEKIFSNRISDKGLISEIYKELIQLKSKNENKKQNQKQSG